MAMTLDELRDIGDGEEQTIVNPNVDIQTVTSQDLRVVNPAEMRGLKKPTDPGDKPEFADVFNNAEKVLYKIRDKNNEYHDLVEQTETSVENLTGGDIADVEGFDPIKMMANPPAAVKGDVRKKEEPVTKDVPVTAAKHTSSKTPDDAIDTQAEKESKYDEDDELLDEIVDATESLKHDEDDYVSDDEDDELEKELDEEDEENSGELTGQRLEELKKQIKEKIKPVLKPFDISSFTVTSKAVSVRNSVAKAANKHTKVADWVLYNSRQHITMEGLMGEDINAIMNTSRRNTTSALRERYQIFYDHILDTDKPDSLDGWLKVVNARDTVHLYAAAYRASFEGVNFLAYDCSNAKCRKSFITDSIPFMEMVKFKDNKVKTDFMDILNREAEGKDEYVSELIPISDTHAITIREASIYDSIIKPSYLDADFREKHQNAIGLSPYIDEMFEIDVNNQQLNPIKFKHFPNNIGKTEKAKVITIDKVIKTLTPDQYNLMLSAIAAISGSNDDSITYIQPEATCPYCGQKLDEETVNMSDMLFLRHQLAALANG